MHIPNHRPGLRGHFLLFASSAGPSASSTPLAWDATAAAVKDEARAATGVAPASVTREPTADGGGYTWTVRFPWSKWLSTVAPPMAVDPSAVSAGSEITAGVNVTSQSAHLGKAVQVDISLTPC